MQARIKKVDGKFIITGGPSNGNIRCGIGEVLVPASVIYPPMDTPVLYMYTGPTVTANAEGTLVEVAYSVGEKSVESIKTELTRAFDAIFTEIDARSLRSVRSILAAQANGETPAEFDVTTMKNYEDAAKANRAIVAEIAAGADFEFFKNNYQRLVPTKPWEATTPAE